MKYYRYLYFPKGLEKKKDKILRRLEKGKFQPFVYLLLLPLNSSNQLEILNSAYLLQPDYPKAEQLVVGIAGSYDDALELVVTIAQEVYTETGGADIRNYILRKEQEG